jgi:hypothetical protein
MVTTPDRRRGSAIHSRDALLPTAPRLAVALALLFATLGWGQASAVPATAADPELKPLTLVYWIGLRDGAEGSDGITFTVEVGEAGKPRTLLASTHHQEQRWQLCTADISAFRDRQVTIRLLADPGQTTVSDWGAWGDVAIVEGRPAPDSPDPLMDPAGTRQPIVFGPHVDRASITISE